MAVQPVKWNSRYQNYIDLYKDIAICEMLQHGIPASITLAQGLLESAAGESDLARKGNNHFGIKCHSWTGPTMHHDDDEQGECFRVYDSPYESFEDHSLFLKRDRYKSLFSLNRYDYAGWARGLKRCGYATNPNYANILIEIIRCYKLDELDHAKSYDRSKVHVTKRSIVQQPTRQPSVTAPARHVVHMNNRNYYVVARQGDTFKSLGKEYNISYRKLARYNERDKRDVLSEGDIVYFEKKRTKADKLYKKVPHVVRRGESMYDIAQHYGIRLKSLYKKNKLDASYRPKVGDRLKVY